MIAHAEGLTSNNRVSFTLHLIVGRLSDTYPSITSHLRRNMIAGAALHEQNS
jgi:hypothetical protein